MPKYIMSTIAAALLSMTAMAQANTPLPEAVISHPFASTAPVPCDNKLRVQTYVVQSQIKLKKVSIWQGLREYRISDVTMTIHSQMKNQNFIIAGHDDYSQGADGGRQFREDFGGLYYVIPAGDVLTFTYGCSKNPELPTSHHMGFIVEFIAVDR